MKTTELTDIDGDALTITQRLDATWITCTKGDEEVTIGPVPTDAVRHAFQEPMGGDDMDGGVTAAAIENEAACGFCHGIAVACGQLAPDGTYACTRREGHDLPHVACCPEEHMLSTWPEKCGLDPARKEAEVVSPERARSLVQENAELRARIGRVEEARDLYRRDAMTAERREQEFADRAEKAERAAKTLGKVVEAQCRDIARITRSEHLVAEDGDADWGAIWERGFSMADSLREANATVKSLRAENPRPLTADDITDEMVERALVRYEQAKKVWPPRGAMRSALMGALTEPQRPEGAEDLDEVCAGITLGGLSLNASDLADYLAARGVRVAGAEA